MWGQGNQACCWWDASCHCNDDGNDDGGYGDSHGGDGDSRPAVGYNFVYKMSSLQSSTSHSPEEWKVRVRMSGMVSEG